MALRLEDVPGERSMDVVAACMESVARIAQDERLVKAMQEADGGTRVQQMAAISQILRDHKADVYSILAAVAGTTVEEYLAARNAGEVLADAYSIMTDDLFGDFLPAARSDTGSRGERSGSTEAQRA